MGEPVRGAVDATFYPVTEKVGEDFLQRLIMELLRPLVERWFRECRRTALVGADQFIYWEQFNARKAVSPDVYVLLGVEPRTPVTAWKVWESGIVPAFAFEVVSSDRLKDYEEVPRKYAELGVQELVLFDPHVDRSSRRTRWQVFRRESGDLTLVETTDADRVRSVVVDAWLRQTGTAMATRVRIGLDPDGTTLLLTDEERAEAAEGELERVRRELEQLRGKI